VNSVATSGTHDTEPLAVWWANTTDEERAEIGRLPTVTRIANGRDLTAAAYVPTVRDILLESLFASTSDLLLLPIQDVFGWSDRINEPATVSPRNWTFRLPWPVDRCQDVPQALERQTMLRAWAERHQR
jgi:4-alpha-glucanotransferase